MSDDVFKVSAEWAARECLFSTRDAHERAAASVGDENERYSGHSGDFTRREREKNFIRDTRNARLDGKYVNPTEHTVSIRVKEKTTKVKNKNQTEEENLHNTASR